MAQTATHAILHHRALHPEVGARWYSCWRDGYGSRERWHDFVLLMVGTGARPAAIVGSTKAQLNFDAGLII
jgi:hypothetical protein